MAKYNAAILGCGAIFNRHLAALKSNAEEFKLISLFDIDSNLSSAQSTELKVKNYSFENDVYNDDEVNCIIILTPSYLHFSQAKKAIEAGKHVIVEKPATFLVDEILILEKLAIVYKVKVFCILQVRLNQSVTVIKKVLENNLLGNLRGASLVQRWQRPADYFNGWRGKYSLGGGLLREFAIHYMDIMQYLLGLPKVCAATFYQNKFKDVEIDDTIYALLDFDSFGGSLEVSVAAEPSNIEISLIISGANGYIKLAGKSLDIIEQAKFADTHSQDHYQQIYAETMGSEIDNKLTQGASPFHPELYRQIILNPELFELNKTYNVIKLIENIYQFKVN